jgi:hypothetical protein
MQLYLLTENFRNLLELMDNPDVPVEVIEAALAELDGEIEDKADNIAKFIKSLEGEIEQIKAERQRLAALEKSKNNNIDRLKTYLYDQMKSINKTKFKTPLFSFGIQKNPPSVDILDESVIEEMYLIPQPPKIDKAKMMEDLKSGFKVDGVVIKQGESLRIK